MTDATFFLLDALLSAAKGMLVSARTKAVMKEYEITEDPRSTSVKFFTNPITNAGTSLISSLIFNKGLDASAKNISFSEQAARVNKN